MPANNLETVVSSDSKTVTISRNGPVAIIGERINPTGRKKLMASLQAGNMDVVRRDAIAQVKAGAAILDVNAGLPGADEKELMLQTLAAVREVTDVPLCIDSPNPEVLEAALKLYPGKALVNSVNGEEHSLRTVLPLVAKYGSAVIGLAMIFSMIIAGISGAAIPIVLKAVGQDPALSSSIILTTVTDVVGFVSFLGLATLMTGTFNLM